MASYAIPSHAIPGLESRTRLADFDYQMFSPPPPALRRANLLGADGLTDPPLAVGLMTSHARGRKPASGLAEAGATRPYPREEPESIVAAPRQKIKTVKKPKKNLNAPQADIEGIGSHSENEQIFSVVPISNTGVYYARLTTILRDDELPAMEEHTPAEPAGPLIPSLPKEEITISNTLGNLRAYASGDESQVWVLVMETDTGATWVRAKQGFAYPSRTRSLRYFLSLRDPLRPSWVKKETLAQYDCPSKQRSPE